MREGWALAAAILVLGAVAIAISQPVSIGDWIGRGIIAAGPLALLIYAALGLLSPDTTTDDDDPLDKP